MSWLSIFYPLSSLYGFITAVRNKLYDKGFWRVYQPTRPRIINVGNLTVGGTGKTPHVEMLIRHFLPTHKVATLSRGYGRKTKGFRVAQPLDLPATLGDEPFQMYQKFGDIPITVGEKRAPALEKIQAIYPEVEVVLLDDAFQHRAVKAHANILLTDFGRLFYEDVPFPVGRLREGRQGAKRADAVIVTKCPPDLPAQERLRISAHIQRYTLKDTPVFFTAFRYSCAQKLPTKGQKINVLTALANPTPFLKYLETDYIIQKHQDFPDHHAYTLADVEKLENLPTFTTEKDWVKLSQPEFAPFWVGRQVYVIVIEPYFLENAQAFWDFLAQKV